MKTIAFILGLIALLAVAVGISINPTAKEKAGDRGDHALLEDGVYPVLGSDDARSTQNGPKGEIVDLAEVPVKDSTKAPGSIRIVASPLVRFRDVSNFAFKFADNQCTQVRFKNTDSLKAYTRDHVGSRLAIVIGGKVITHHKIREPLATQEVRITFCTEGGGEHLRKHLGEIKAIDARAEVPQKNRRRRASLEISP